MIDRIERFRQRRERPHADLDLDAGVVEEVQRPSGVVTGSHQHGPIRFVDVADGDRPRRPGSAADRRDPGDLALEDQVFADLVRQRARCQDLPSVCVDGA